HRLFARLGRKRHDAARREGSHRRKLRAHPPLEPHRHGRAAADVQGRPECRVARTHRQGKLRDHRLERRRGEDGHGRRHRGQRYADQVRGASAHRHAERARVLPARRHPALRAAAARLFKQGRIAGLRSGARGASSRAADDSRRPAHSLSGAAMSADHLVTLDGHVLRRALARVDKKNALTSAMYATLIAQLERAESDPDIHVVLFEAEGGTFCAGNDLNDFAAVARGTVQASELKAYGFIQMLARATKPYVAAVQGAAIGIGTTLLLHCDLVYVAEDAILSTPFVNLAPVPEA